MANRRKAKGYRVERELVKMFEALPGWEGRRQPGSGQYLSFPHDLEVIGPKGTYVVEVKARANGEGFKTLDRWRGQAEILILKADRAEPGVYMPWRVFADIVGVDLPEEEAEEG